MGFLGAPAWLLVESAPMPLMAGATALLGRGLALPEDMLMMRFGGSAWEVRRGRVGDAVRNAPGRPPMRLIMGRASG